MFLGVWYNLGVSDCPAAWGLQRAPLGRFSPPRLEPWEAVEPVGGQSVSCPFIFPPFGTSSNHDVR